MMNSKFGRLALLMGLILPTLSSAEVIRLSVAPSRGNPLDVQIEGAAKQFNRVANSLTKAARLRNLRSGRGSAEIPFSMPVVVQLNTGTPPAGNRGHGIYAAGIVLQFDATGTRSFPAEYRNLLQSVFDQSVNTLNAVFGQPALGGIVRVRNYDADIQDRDAVAGGIYLPNNGSGEREVRFPVYSSPEAAAVNFVHCLLLAYQGTTPYGFDAFQEGLTRAATMRVVRTPGTMPNVLDPELLESALQNSYDIGLWYDWYNQPALGGPSFIAPNLKDVPLPSGGSLGGIYLLRYLMAGSAWQKLLAENPGFIAEFNQRFYAAPSAASDVSALIAIGQAALDTVTGTTDALIEGLSFRDWFKSQRILETKLTRGAKVLVQPTPLEPVPGSTDFGVFDVVANFFETLASGDEVLSSGTSYPIFWDNTFNRLFPSSQEDRMDIAGAYGSVTPNLPNLLANEPYRCTIDLPIIDRLARVYVPAGAIATGLSTVANTFYGTLIGLPLDTGETARIRVTAGSFTFDNCPVKNGAFGALIDDSSFTGYQALTIEVIRTSSGVDTVVMTRKVNKGPGALAVDLRVGGSITYVFPSAIGKGMSLMGLPLEPLDADLATIFGLNPSTFLAARYNSSRSKYDYYPDFGAGALGSGFFQRLNSAQVLSVKGFTHPGTPISIALRPGWNVVTSPLPEDVTTANIRVIRAAEFPRTFAESLGIELGLDFFQFVPGELDAVTGAPESGTFSAATLFRVGRGYLVRCLAPEGVTLVFDPSSPTPSRGTNTPLSPPAGWVNRLSITHAGRVAQAFFGSDSQSTRSFDRKTDSALPPKPVSGLQISIGNRQFRDMRRNGVREVFPITIEGLKKGQTYDMRMMHINQAGRFSLYDPITRRSYVIRTPDTYRFTATSSVRHLQIVVNGGQR